MIDLQPPKGTRDFPPEEMRVRNWLFGHFRDVARSFGFDEFDAPVLETEELYVRKAGEEITQQLYNFEDKGNRRVALRPELTPSFARLILQQGKSLALPAKWFAVGQCWRYERITRGRRREHYQWNMDIWGVPGVTAEAEVLAAVVGFFERVGIDSADVGIKINSREVLAELLAETCGVDQADGARFAATCVLVDKLEKVPAAKLYDDFAALELELEAPCDWAAVGIEQLLERSSEMGRRLRAEQQRVVLAARGVRALEDLVGAGAKTAGEDAQRAPKTPSRRPHATPMPSPGAMLAAARGGAEAAREDGGARRVSPSGGLLLRIHDLEEQVEVGKLLLQQEKANHAKASSWW